MSVALRVYIPETDATKVIKFDSRMTIEEAILIIFEKANLTNTSPYGIFVRNEDGSGKWLKEDRTLVAYDLKQNDNIEFRKKQRPLKLKLVDGSQKTVIVDESIPVIEVVRQLAKRIGLANPDEFSLTEDGKADWLNPNLSLVEQNIKSDITLVMKKKLFFSDANIDTSDAAELHLVYSQTVRQIITEELRCGLDEAITLAALQLQATHGNHNPNKHKPGFIKLEEFIPLTFLKNKTIDKDIFTEHKKLSGLSEVNAKYRYVQTCRQLKTYGITFFTIKEKTKKDKKPVPRLLGVTRDSILRMDAETKEIIAHYPLNHLRRWAANVDNFTMDFGEYEEEYVVVLTNEADKISQLISGYIDIILQKRREASRANRKFADEEYTATEEVLSPVRAQAIRTVVGASAGGVAQSAGGAVAGAAVASFASAGSANIVRTEAKFAECSAILANVEACWQTVDHQTTGLVNYHPAQNLIQTCYQQMSAAVLQGTGIKLHMAENAETTDMTTLSGELLQCGEALVKCTSQLMAATTEEQVNAAVQGIIHASARILDVSARLCPFIGSKDTTSQQKLVEASQLVATATQQILDAQQSNDRQALMNAAKVLASATALLLASGDVKRLPSQPKIMAHVQGTEGILDAAKAVSQGCSRLLQIAKVAGSTYDPELAEKVVAASKTISSSSDDMYHSARFAAERITVAANDPAIQARLIASAKSLGTAVASLMSAVQSAASTIPVAQQNTVNAQALAVSAKAVADAISKLVTMAKTSMENIPQHMQREELQQVVGQVEGACSELVSNLVAQSSETMILGSVNALASACAKLSTIARAASLRAHTEEKKNFLQEAAASVNDLTSEIFSATKNALLRIEDEEPKTAVKGLIAKLGQVCDILLKHQQADDLADSASTVAMSAKAFESLSGDVAQIIPTEEREAFKAQLGEVSSAIAELTELKNKEDRANRLGDLVSAARRAQKAASDLVSTTKKIAVACPNPTLAKRMAALAMTTEDTISRLVSSYRAAGSDQKDVDDVVQSADGVVTGLSQLVLALGSAPAEFAAVAKQLVVAANGVVRIIQAKVAEMEPGALQDQLTSASKLVASGTVQIIPLAKMAQVNREDVEQHRKLLQAVHALTGRLESLVSAAQASFSGTAPSRTVLSAHEAAIAAVMLATNVPLVSIEAEKGEEALRVVDVSDPESILESVARGTKTMTQETTSMTLASGAVAVATSKLLIAIATGKEDLSPETAVLSEASGQVVNIALAKGDQVSSIVLRKQLQQAARAVANATSSLVASARRALSDSTAKEELTSSCKDVALFTQQVIASSKIADVLIPLDAALSSHETPDLPQKQAIVDSCQKIQVAIENVFQASTQPDLVSSAKALAQSSSSLTTAAREGVTVVSDPSSKQSLLDAAKAVADGTAALITAARNRMTKNEPKFQLEKSARALRLAAGQVAQIAESSSVQSLGDAIIANSKAVVANTMELIAAAGSKDELVSVAKLVAASTSRLGATARNLASMTVDSTLQGSLFDTAHEIADATASIVECSRKGASDPEVFQRMMTAANGLIVATQKVVNSSKVANELLAQEAESVQDDAEQELVNAAKAIEALAAKITPVTTESGKILGKQESEVAENIVVFAKSITSACSRLIGAARSSQRELAALKKAKIMTEEPTEEERANDSLVRAAKSVVGSCGMLVESSNECVQAKADEAKMIAAAQSVSAATAQLVAATRVRAKPGSKIQEKLQGAARAVTQATGSLVKAAQESLAKSEAKEADEEDMEELSFAEMQKREIEAKMKIIQLEKQLEAARKEMLAFNKSKYQKDK
eukprot:TRINITY_DN611_c0_g1_i1.p1 TRINITY_DN611_c0_g1~~TRINITY_DN611_c0_g1_i1.p1  ORF type:complete len:1815 (-),score=510.74 TRINITY_DN611_c0_g1_i1:219-5663(-)